MSRGLGRIQRECLRVIAEYEAAGRRPTTFNVACEVYRVARDRDGNRMINEAQHVATKRALANLRRNGLVTGQQDITLLSDGTRIFTFVGADGLHAERCCLWSITAKTDHVTMAQASLQVLLEMESKPDRQRPRTTSSGLNFKTRRASRTSTART
jgi:hypothetical protein